MRMETQPDSTHDLSLLEKIEQNPDATQASLASQLGVAVGTVNWHLKRLGNLKTMDDTLPLDFGPMEVHRRQRVRPEARR